MRAPDKPTIRRARGRPIGWRATDEARRKRLLTPTREAAEAAAHLTWFAWGGDGKPYEVRAGYPPRRPALEAGERMLTVKEAVRLIVREYGLNREEKEKIENLLRTGRTQTPTFRRRIKV